MGQGRYVAIVFGLDGRQAKQLMTRARPRDEDGFYGDWASKNVRTVAEEPGAEICQSYESPQEWVGAIITISDEYLADHWGGSVLRKGTWCLGTIETVLKGDVSRAKRRWARFVSNVEKATGYKAPAGRVLLVSDFH